MRGRTTLLIAHRRSTLQLADRIAVLDEGRVADTGTHEELLARCPLYRLLLSGPGDDVEGVDAGELAFYENEAACGVRAASGPRRTLASRLACGARRRQARDGQHRRRHSRRLRRRGRSAPGGRRCWLRWRGGGQAGRGERPSGRRAARHRRGGGAIDGGMLASVPPTPELLAQVDAAAAGA